MARTERFVATRIAALMTSEYGGKWELVEAYDAPDNAGRRVVLEDPMEEAQYVITVQRRSTVAPIEATVTPRKLNEVNLDGDEE